MFDNTKEWYGDRESGGVGAPARASDAYAQVSEAFWLELLAGNHLCIS